MINVVPLDDHVLVVPTALRKQRGMSPKSKRVYFTKKMKWENVKAGKTEGS